jgi:hypothetical protein
MHDDERYTLGASQRAGEFTPVDSVSDAQSAYFERKWVQLGWLDAETGKLTRKGMSAKGGKEPPECIPIAPVDIEADVVIAPVEDVSEPTFVELAEFDSEPDE